MNPFRKLRSSMAGEAVPEAESDALLGELRLVRESELLIGEHGTLANVN